MEDEMEETMPCRYQPYCAISKEHPCPVYEEDTQDEEQYGELFNDNWVDRLFKSIGKQYNCKYFTVDGDIRVNGQCHYKLNTMFNTNKLV